MRKLFEKLKTKKPSKVGIQAVGLIPFSYIYKAITAFRLFLYSAGIVPSSSVEGIKVLSIGNITVGGTGKTPTAIMIAKTLLTAGRKVCVVSRGYGRESLEEVQVVSNGEGKILARYPQAADEALLVAGELRAVPVICSAKRVDGIKAGKEKFDCDTAILDDAFSHFSAKRDIDLLLLDASYPFGNGWMIPAGPLREPVEAIKRADAILLTRANLADGAKIEKTKNEIKKITADAKIFLLDILPCEIILPDGERSRAESFFNDVEKIILLSGIASPKQFELTVKNLGGKVKKHFAFPDHYSFSESDAEDIFKDAEAGTLFLTTQKDFVRIPAPQKVRFHQLTVNAIARDKEGFKSFLAESL